MNIVLTGYRGVGKTAVGKILSRKLKSRFIDTDDEVERLAKTSIAELVAKSGWKRMRSLERVAVRAAMRSGRAVVATGGGAFTESRIRFDRKKNLVILLTADSEVIASRIAGSGRPSITGKGAVAEIRQVLREREKKYFGIADVAIDTSEASPQEAARIILGFLKHARVKQ